MSDGASIISYPKMKALKHVSGILLATVAVVFVLGSVTQLTSNEPEIPAWGVGIMFTVLGLLPLAGAVALLKRRVGTVPPVNCPACGGAERAPAGLFSKRNFWMMHLGGWLLSSLWGASREQQVRCVQCDALYFTETRGTRIAGIALWVLILLVLLGAIAQQFQEHS
jgi:hypothetical protein